MFSVLEPHWDVLISVTPFTGDPDLYVTACGYIDGHYPGPDTECISRPKNTTDKYQWSRAGFGNDTVYIRTGSPGSCTPQPGVPCDYYIGVYGYESSSFAVTASMKSDRPSSLVLGQPTRGTVRSGAEDLYRLDLTSGHDMIEVSGPAPITLGALSPLLHCHCVSDFHDSFQWRR